MKNKHLFVAGAVASLLTISCAKENMNNVTQEAATADANYKTSAETMAENTMANAWNDYNAQSHQEIIERIETLKANITASNVKGNQATSGGEEPVSDIFTIYEGYFNHDNGNYGDEATNVEKVPFTFSNIPVHQNPDGNMYIYNADLTQFHQDAAAQLGIELNARNGKTHLLTDFNTITFSPDLTSATIDGHFLLSNLIPFQTPANAYFGAENLGDCQTADHSADAAVFIQAYLNNTINHNCNNGYTTIIFTDVNTDVPPYLPNLLANMNPLQNCWNNEVNSCVGDDNDQANNNAIWNSWYNKADNLRSAGLNYVQNLSGAPSDIKFLTTDYKSYPPNWGSFNFNGGAPNLPDSYFHAGDLFYGTIICL